MTTAILNSNTPGAQQITPSPYFAWRLPLERFLAVVLLVLASPLLLALMALVRLSSPGAAIYRQTRVGKDGQPFEIFKLRTMYHNAERLSGPVWCQPGDARVTPIGKVLRRLHLDELPQLFNVVHGEMSLVGPRPERPEFVVDLAKRIPHYTERLCVRPGITGVAQIHLPPDTDEQSVRKKVALDLEYIHTVTVRQDVEILLLTLLHLLGAQRVARRVMATANLTSIRPVQHPTSV